MGDSSPPAIETAWLQAEADAHREALAAFIATVEGLPLDRWNAPQAAGKWSPAEIAEHLRMTYATVMAELAGGSGFRLRTKPWLRWFLRLTYLPRILRSGRFPKGIQATREVRPGAGPYDRDQLLSTLRRDGERFLDMVAAAPRGSTFTHPFLGSLPLRDGMRFASHHVRHHHAQVVAAGDGSGA